LKQSLLAMRDMQERARIVQKFGYTDQQATYVHVVYRVFQKELYINIPNITVWRVSRERLHLKA
jgi:hypothetical protein